MLFEWDDVKEKINIAKHGLDFGTAALVFQRLMKDFHSCE